ncbi:MAG: ribonuclease R, partial [Atopostipes suicloacalis]|nr:ribonuclease R [Atopostipes suicloacalis]
MKKKKELKKLIIDFMEEKDQGSYVVNDITKGLGYQSSDDFKKVVKALASLERDRVVLLTKDGQFRLMKDDPSFTGPFSGTEKGFGFVTLENFDSDVFIPPNKVGTALSGDTVKVNVSKKAKPWKDKGAEGEVVEVIERGTSQIVGEFHAYDKDEVKDLGFYGYVQPETKKLKHLTVQIETKGIRPVEGQIIIVELTEFARYENEDLQGIATKVIGHKDDPGIDILSIAYKHGINPEFPETVTKELEDIPNEVQEEEMDGRRDLRDQKIITIDGEDAKDLDDAISIEKLENGNYLLGVHIADVAHYVREGSAIDQEAFERGTSSYLIDRVIPMLPQKLSNGICSLHPNTERLTLSCDIEINHTGKIVDYEIYPSIISSYKRMSYEEVNRILMDEDPAMMNNHEDVVSMLQSMESLHSILEEKRTRNGAISFDTTELDIQVDEDGKPVEINLVERGIGERIIESFMLSANEAVSLEYSKKNLPFLYRVHEQPDEAKMQNFIEFVSALGVQVKGQKDSITPKVLQGILEEVKGEDYEEVVSTLMLRSMQRARYDVEALGHYGLASEYYSHFTAPIRRYPDLTLHRQIHYYQEEGTGKKAKKYWSEKLPEIAEYSSVAERRAIDAEREVEDLKMAEYMQDKVGQKFEAMITSITNFGMFVQVEDAVEGLVHMSSMKNDYYEYNERGMMLIGKRTGEKFRIGEKVTVKLVNVDIEQYDIDFELAGDSSNKKKKNNNNKNQKNNKRNKNKEKKGKNKKSKKKKSKK